MSATKLMLLVEKEIVEDAIQAAAALNVKASHLSTRNARDFKTLPIEVLTPEELLQSL